MQDDADVSELVGAYPTCGACGGRNVRRDAWAVWHMATHDWQLADLFDEVCCPDCESACALAWRIDKEFRTRRIRRLNDLVRLGDLQNATVVATQGIRAWGDTFVLNVAQAVIAFDAFTKDNDPHGEHDFGALDVNDQNIFWKIDYFNQALSARSPDPANRDVTHRVLTIMLASEY